MFAALFFFQFFSLYIFTFDWKKAAVAVVVRIQKKIVNEMKIPSFYSDEIFFTHSSSLSFFASPSRHVCIQVIRLCRSNENIFPRLLFPCLRLMFACLHYTHIHHQTSLLRSKCEIYKVGKFCIIMFLLPWRQQALAGDATRWGENCWKKKKHQQRDRICIKDLAALES